MVTMVTMKYGRYHSRASAPYNAVKHSIKLFPILIFKQAVSIETHLLHTHI